MLISTIKSNAMNRKVVVLIIIGLLQSCNTTEPPPPPDAKPTLNLELEDISSIEAWIKLSTSNLQFPTTVTLKQNNTVTQDIVLSNADTVIYVDSLLPNATYTFQAITQSSNQSVTSNELSVTTMDTTSHNFTWQTFTFGEHGNSVLRDVAIIDENNIWAVGKIFLNDSTGQPDSQPYNAAHWHGNEWEIIRIPTRTFSGTISSSEIKTIFSFSTNDIWTFSIAGSYSHWNGIEWETEFVDEREGSGLKLWGSNSNNLYLVGTGGSISLYNGTSWQKIESGTNIDLRDIWGTNDGGIIWVTGYDSGFFNTVLLKYNGTIWQKLYEGSPNNQNNNYYIGLLRAVWTNSNLFTYLMNDEAIYRQYDKPEIDLIRITGTFSHVGFAMRGSGKNNLFIVGQHGLVGHYNGFSFKEFPGLKNNNDYLYAVDVKDNTACVVGKRDQGVINDKAIVHLIK